MQVQEILNIVSQQAQAWSPALAAVIGVIIAVVSTSRKVKNGLDEVHNVAVDIQEQKTIKDLANEVKALRTEQKKLIKQQSEIIDKITKVKGYEDVKKR